MNSQLDCPNPKVYKIPIAIQSTTIVKARL